MTLPAQADIVDRLRKAMEGVTPGPWHTDRMKMSRTASVQRLYVAGSSDVVSPHDGVCEPDRYNDRSFREDDANMRYIALCSPDNIGALLDTISRLTADNEALRKGMESFRETLRVERDCRLNEVRLKEDAKNRADALAQGAERLKDDNRVLARALFWFVKYPEYKPSPEFMEEVISDVRAARPLVPSTRAALGDRP